MTLDALDEELEDEELDDFDSLDHEYYAPADHSYLKSMWGGFRAQAKELAEDTVLAHGMVQAFVNAFARDGRYIVVFDAATSTAGTDMKAKFVTITPSPIADRNLTAEEAGLILTALSCHEVCHPRYGRMTWQAVQKVFPGNSTADRISNLLDDIRIEKRFVADYPGYAGIFDPALDYIGAAGMKPGELRIQTLHAPVNLAIAATRYPKFSDWTDPEIAAERDWWIDWSERGAREDAPKRHVDFIREALLHIADIRKKIAAKRSQMQKSMAASAPSKSPEPTPESTPGSSEPRDEDSSEHDSTRSEDAAQGGEDGEGLELSDFDLNAATKPAQSWDPHRGDDEEAPVDACSGASAIDKAAVQGNVNMGELRNLRQNADSIVESARNRESDGHDGVVDVNRSLRGITGGLPRAVPSAIAAKYVRNAIMQSRTGHTDHAPFKRHGRLDQRGLARVARGDFRVFEKRTAPSVGRYNIWVMVDASDSMTWGDQWSPKALQHAASVAHAMAVASKTIPTVRMSLWAWSDAFRPGGFADAGAALAWKTGMNTDQALRLSTVKTGGTPDATIMGWAARAIKKDTEGEETPVIIFISDGAGDARMNERVAEARRAGVEVYGVSFAGGMQQTDEARFGKGNVVPWMGSIEETARPLAKLFARITGGKR